MRYDGEKGFSRLVGQAEGRVVIPLHLSLEMLAKITEGETPSLSIQMVQPFEGRFQLGEQDYEVKGMEERLSHRVVQIDEANGDMSSIGFVSYKLAYVPNTKDTIDQLRHRIEQKKGEVEANRRSTVRAKGLEGENRRKRRKVVVEEVVEVVEEAKEEGEIGGEEEKEEEPSYPVRDKKGMKTRRKQVEEMEKIRMSFKEKYEEYRRLRSAIKVNVSYFSRLRDELRQATGEQYVELAGKIKEEYKRRLSTVKKNKSRYKYLEAELRKLKQLTRVEWE